MTTPDPELVPPRGYVSEEVRQMYGFGSIDRVWKLAQQGRIPGAYKIGNQWRFARAAVDAHLAGEQVAV